MEQVRDRGQAAIVFVSAVSVVFVALVIALGSIGERIVDRARAQTAADAIALASLSGGRSAAERLATRHAAELVSWSRGPGQFDVVVVVRVDDELATAAATNEP